ncbi:hypothetical protein C5J99_20200, partial [Shigella flexneri]
SDRGSQYCAYDYRVIQEQSGLKTSMSRKGNCYDNAPMESFWGISPRQPSGKNIIRWLLKKRTNGSVRYCQYTSPGVYPHSRNIWNPAAPDGAGR